MQDDTTTPSGAQPFASDLDYLQAELKWVQVRAQFIIAHHQFEDANAQEDDVEDVYDDEDAYDEEDEDEHEDEEQDEAESAQARYKQQQAEERKLRSQIDARLALHKDNPLALDRLCALYDLGPFERNILILSMAPCFSRSFDSLFGRLEKTDYYTNTLNVESAFNFQLLSFAERIEYRRYFTPKSALLAHDLITIDMNHRYSTPKDLLSANIQITHRTFSFLLGDNSLDDAFLDFSSVEEPKVEFDQVVLEAKHKQRILSVVERHEDYLQARKEWGFDDIIRYGRGILMLFHGKPGTGKTMMAHAIARHMQKRILNVDIPTFLQHHETDRFLPGLFREARLQDAILFFDECEVLFGSRYHGNNIMTILLTELERFEGVAILATNIPEALDPALDRRILVKVHFPSPDRQARHEIWQKHLPSQAPLAPDVDLQNLADRFELAGGYIKNAVLMAVAAAVHDAQSPPQITMAHLENAAHEQQKQTIETEDDLLRPKARLEEVILPDASKQILHELIAATRHQRVALERWKIGEHLTFGKGISALLHGAPGTGKTLCAEAIARELNRPLMLRTAYTLIGNLSADTARNLQHTFAQAARQHAILLIEHLDALFTSETSSSSFQHHENLETFFLQLLEHSSQLLLLTTRHIERIPRSLQRAIPYQLSFPLPSEHARLQIWQTLFPETVPSDGTIDLNALSQDHNFNGRQIRNASLHGAFRAASQTPPQLSQTLLQDAAAQLHYTIKTK